MVDKGLHGQLAWLRLCFQQVLHGAKHSIWHTEVHGGCHSLLFPPSPHAITLNFVPTTVGYCFPSPYL